MRTVPAMNGLQWIVDALRLFLRGGGVLLVQAMLLLLLTQIPLLGFFISLLLSPALLAGMIASAAQLAQGQRPGIGGLFRAFDGKHRLPGLIALCLPGIVLGLLFVIALSVVLLHATGGDPAAVEALQANPKALFALLAAHAGALLLLAFVLLLLGMALTFFAAAQVMLAGQGGFAAMGQSVRAVLRNVLALLLMLIALMVLGVIGGLLFAVLVRLGAGFGAWWQVLWTLVLFVLGYAYSATLMYVAWRDVFGAGMQAQFGGASSDTQQVHAEM